MRTRLDRPGAGNPSAPGWRRAAALRGALFAGLWLVLTEGSLYSPALAALTIAGATAASLALLPPGAWRLRPLAMVRFVAFFFGNSVRGGIDVAMRALHPALPIRPGYIAFPLRLRTAPARAFMAAALSLLPGTASVRIGPDVVHVHVLDTGQPAAETLRQLEDLVAAMFDEALETPRA